MTAVPVYAIQAQAYYQYDGTNGSDIVQVFEDSSPGITSSVTDSGTHLRFYVAGAAGIFVDLDVNDWISLGPGVITDADFQAQFIQKP